MNKIVPHLWYDQGAVEAARFYASIFKDSSVSNVVTMSETPSGTVEMVTLTISGQDFMMLSAGPYFKFTPSISFRVDCATKEEVDFLWYKLSECGTVMMALDTYPFSAWYGWTEDRFGLSWQIMLVSASVIKQKITPTLMFTGEHCGKAEQAIHFYTAVFKISAVSGIRLYGDDEEPDKAGTIKHAAFTLEGQAFAAMDSAYSHEFTFNEAISLLVNCETQEEIDYFWAKLSFVPEAEQCGWLKDQFGVSWQIVPTVMSQMLATDDPEKMRRVTEAFLKMKKFDIAALVDAFEGR